MRSLFKFIIAALILTACSQTPILPTITPLPSMTPTQIPTVTPTVLPTFTSTPPAPDLTPAAADILKNLGPTFTMEQLNHPETILFVDFDTLNSPEFAEAMVYAANHGLLPVPSANAVPIDHINYYNDPSKLDGSGSGPLFAPSNRLIYEDMDKRPWVPALILKTVVNGVEAYVTYFNVQNKDGSYGLYAMLDVFPKDISFAQYEYQRLGMESGYIPTGKFFGAEKGCKKNFEMISRIKGDNLEKICQWAMDQQGGVRENVFESWSDPANGKLNNQILNENGEVEFFIPIVSIGNDGIQW